MTDKCLMGGINENWIKGATVQEIENHLREAVDCGGRKG